jgi:hypothetical protein
VCRATQAAPHSELKAFADTSMYARLAVSATTRDHVVVHRRARLSAAVVTHRRSQSIEVGSPIVRFNFRRKIASPACSIEGVRRQSARVAVCARQSGRLGPRRHQAAASAAQALA